MDLREKNKQARRRRILDAATKLLQKGGAEALTMRDLARASKVSEMTPYNLFGSKGGIVAALFEDAVGRVVARSFDEMPADPIERLFVSAEALADAWTEDTPLFRELLRTARESGADLSRYADGPISLLQAGLLDATNAGLLHDDVPAPELARHVFVANQGVYDRWVDGEIDDATLRTNLILALGISLLSVATPATRKKVLARMAKARRGSTRSKGHARKRSSTGAR